MFDQSFRVIMAAALLTLVLSAGYGHCEQITVDVPPSAANAGGAPMRMTFDGKFYTDSWWFHEVEAGKFSADADEAFMLKVVRTNATGNPDDIRALWAPDERAKIGDLLGKVDVFKANRSFFQQVTDSAFIAKIFYGSYTIFVIQHAGTFGNKANLYTITKVDGVPYLSNKLSADPVHQVLIHNYLNSVRFKTRPE